MTDRPTDPQGQGQPPWGQQGPQWGQPAPYGQQWGQPAPYGQQPYGAPAPYGPYGGAPVTTSSRSTTVLVLGIVSLVTLFTCGLTRSTGHRRGRASAFDLVRRLK